MRCADRPNTLCILVVSEDRTLTRELSHFLGTAGYRTLVAAQPQMAERAVETGEPHIALVDARLGSRDHWALCRHLGDGAADGGLLKCLLIEKPDVAQLQEALDAGIDDVFLMPLCYGEILARLRSAARLLEYDRRASRQELLDAMTGLPSQSTLIAQVRRRWLAENGQKTPMACVLIDLDFFAAICNIEGHGDTRMLLVSITAELHKAGGADILACLGDDRFAAILFDADSEAACQWAERIRTAIAEKTYDDKPNCRITASCGVACSESAESVEELLAQATNALASAKASGRNCVMHWGQQGDDPVAAHPWDNFFSRTVAADVLTVCTVFLQEDESLKRATALFRQTHLEAIPVVDADGKLVGLCTEDQVEDKSAADQEELLVRDVMVASPRSFEPKEELSALIEFFDAEPLAWAVVVDDDRPLGLLNCDGLLGLSRPASELARGGDAHFTDSTEYSLVPDFAIEEPAGPA